MVCTHCGSAIPVEDFQCPQCGKRRTIMEVLAEPPEGPPPPLRGVGGRLALLVAYLVFLVPLSAALFLTRHAYGLFIEHSTKLNTSPSVLFTWIGGLALVTFGLYAGILLWKERPRAVAVTKRFLLAWLSFGTLSALLPHAPVADRAWGLADALLWFFVWYSYLVLSKRVANTYG
ncbi:MAG TPA: zinc ribbon domain-containing protein [Candidatus Aquilonibacter sp.]|nr:zinc ribbon domain-containing protein [Candidatus Aquilonibacter sp.]